MGIVYFLLKPTEYELYDNKIVITIGWVFHYQIPFGNLKSARRATWKDLWGPNLNLINSYSSGDILQITRWDGPKIHITPNNRQVFLNYLNGILPGWRRGNYDLPENGA